MVQNEIQTLPFDAWNPMVTLASLRPLQPTDLTDISTLLRGPNARIAALPAELPESILISVARDLRSLENLDSLEGDGSTSLAGPMTLLLTILLESTAENGSSLSIGERAMFECLKTYQWAVERELVTRLTGTGGRDDMDMLLRCLEHINSNDSSEKPVGG